MDGGGLGHPTSSFSGGGDHWQSPEQGGGGAADGGGGGGANGAQDLTLGFPTDSLRDACDGRCGHQARRSGHGFLQTEA